MREKNNKLAIVYIFIAVLGRLIPHPPNVTPMTSLCLFAGAKLSRTWAILVGLLSIIISDILLSLIYGYPMFGYWSFFSYTGFGAIVLLGSRLNSSPKTTKLFGFVICSTLGFWLWTNFGSWLLTPYYTKDFAGMFTCYFAAIPFLRNALLGDIIWAVVIFGLYKKLAQRFFMVASYDK